MISQDSSRLFWQCECHKYSGQCRTNILCSSVVIHFHLLPRYGPEERTVEQYPAQSVNHAWNQRLLDLNRFLLDNILASGSSCSYNAPYANRLVPCLWIQPQANIGSIMDKAISVRVNQLFCDGNHRSAVLFIYESMADLGFNLSANPFEFYIKLSHRNCLCGLTNDQHRKDVLNWMVKYVDRRKHRSAFINRRDMGEKVKGIAMMNSVMGQLVDTLRGRSYMDQRSACRNLKRQHPIEYRQMRVLASYNAK